VRTDEKDEGIMAYCLPQPQLVEERKTRAQDRVPRTMDNVPRTAAG